MGPILSAVRRAVSSLILGPLMSSFLTLMVIAGVCVAGAGATTDLKTYVIPGQGISLAVPATWRAIDYRQARSRAQIKRFLRGHPVDFYSTITTLRAPGSPIKFVAIDPEVHF